MTNKIWAIAIFLIASFLLTNFSPEFLPSKEAENSPLDSAIVVGYSNWAGWWPWAIAEEKGLFANNLQVELRWYDNYSQSLQDLADGYIDSNCQTLSDTISFASEAVKGEVVVLVNDNSAGNDKIITNAEINKVEELENKTVALEVGVVSDFLLSLALDRVGMSREQVRIIDAETGAAVEAFLADQTDAVGAFPPFWYTALQKDGAKEIISSAEFPGAIPDLLVVSQELVDNHPDKVQTLVNTWFDVLDFMAKNNLEADEIMARRAGIDLKELQVLKSGTKMFNLEDNLNAFRKSDSMESLFYAAREITTFLQEKLNIIESKPNISRLLNSQFIKAYSANSTSYAK